MTIALLIVLSGMLIATLWLLASTDLSIKEINEMIDNEENWP